MSRLLAGKLDRFSVDVLLRTVEKLGAEFTYDAKADDEAVREYTKLLTQCRKAKTGTERETVNAVVKVLRSMKSPIIDRRLNHKQRLEVIMGDMRDTPRQDLDWMTKQLESLIAEMRCA